MFRESIFATIVFIVFASFHTEILAGQSSIKISLYQINGKKSIHAVSDKFFSFTVDPGVLLHVPECGTLNNTWNLIKGILPAYLRIAGPDSNRLVFRSFVNGKPSSDTGVNSGSNLKSGMIQLTGPQWVKFNEFVSKSGLNIIISLNGDIFNKNNDRDLSNALEFIKFSNENNLNVDWQLGYELQKISKDDGRGTGHDVAKLKNILELFPLYHKSLILGPDMTSFENRDEATFIKNYLVQAQNSLNAFTIHPDFSKMKENDDVQEMLSNILLKLDNVLWSKENTLKIMSKGIIPRKPIWIAESERKNQTCTFSDALSMIKRLGSAAKLGVSVYLQKPHLLSLFEPTPEYWAAVLFKALVGRGVLDMKLVNGNNTKLQLFSHCTQILEKPEEGIINPTTAYERGSVTTYGVNTGFEPARLSFKVGFKIEDMAHLYVLTEETKDEISKTLLNKQSLGLSSEGELPMISPKVRESVRYLTVPARSIFFIVFPNAKSRACATFASEEMQDSKIKTKLPYNEEDEATDDISFASNLPETVEDDAEDKEIYVSYPKREERRKMARPKLIPHTDDFRFMQPKSEPNFGVKYVAFPDGSWLSPFPEKFREFLNRDRQYEEFMKTSPTRKEIRQLKMEKHGLSGKAILSRRNYTNAMVESENTEAHFEPTFTEEKPGRFIRSIDLHPMVLLKSPKINDKYFLPIVTHSVWSPFQSNSFFNQLRETVFVDEERRKKRETNVNPLSKRQISDNNEMDNETSASAATIIDYPVQTTVSTSGENEQFDWEVDELEETARKNRQISDHPGIENKSFSETEILAMPKKVPRTFGPVSPFSHKPKPVKKFKSLKARKTENNTVGSPQSAVIPGIVSSAKISNIFSAEDKVETNASVTTSESTKEIGEKSAIVDNVTEAVFISSSQPTTSESSISEVPAKSFEESSKNVPETSSQMAESSIAEVSTISITSTSVKSVALDKLSGTQSLARNENADEDALEDIQLATKIVSPILHTDHHINVNNKTKNLHSKSEAENNQVSLSLTPRTRSKDARKEIKAKPKRPSAAKMVTKPTLDIKATRMEPAQLIDLYNAKIKELLDQHLAKLEEVKRKIHEKSAAAKKTEPKHVPRSRNKREISSTNNTLESLVVDSKKENQSQPENDIVGIRWQKPMNPVHSVTAEPTLVSSTSKVFVPKKSRHARLQTSTAKYTRVRTSPAPKSANRENKIKPAITHRPRTDPILRQKRDSFLDNTFATVEGIYKKVSKEVKEDTEPITKWVEDRVDDVNEKFNVKRDKRDLTAVREKLAQRRQQILDRVEHRLLEREAKSQFAEGAKKHCKKGFEALREKARQVREKALGKIKHHHLVKRDVNARRAKIAEKKKQIEEQKRKFEFRFNLLKNKTAKSHAGVERKKAEQLRSHAIFKRQTINDQAAANRLRRSVLNNDIFDDNENNIEFRMKNYDSDSANDYFNKRFNNFDRERRADDIQSEKVVNNDLKSFFPKDGTEEKKPNLKRVGEANEDKIEVKQQTNSIRNREHKSETIDNKGKTEFRNSENTRQILSTTTEVTTQEENDRCKDTNFFRYCWCKATYLLQYFSKFFHLQG